MQNMPALFDLPLPLWAVTRGVQLVCSSSLPQQWLLPTLCQVWILHGIDKKLISKCASLQVSYALSLFGSWG